MIEFAENQWERALRSLQSSKKLIETDPDSAASRAYYAAFHAVTALFALRGQEFTKHSAVRGAVHRDLIHGGNWSPELGQDYDFCSISGKPAITVGLYRFLQKTRSLLLEQPTG